MTERQPTMMNNTPPRKKGLWWAFRMLTLVAAASVGGFIVFAGSVYGYLRFTGNIHEVEPGMYYRSGQLGADKLTPLIRKYGIRTILNLRGSNGSDPWYEVEAAISDAAGVRHIDYGLSAYHPVTSQQMADILTILRDSPKPILVHCEQGADRTGLTTALYRLSRGADAETAEQELSLRYGHFPYLVWRGTQAMDDSLHAYIAARRSENAE